MTDGYGRSRAELEAIARAAEAQLRRAEFLRRLQSSAQPEAKTESFVEQVRPYIALSREEGVPVRAIAEALSKRTGMPVWDRELLEFMAENRRLPTAVLEALDETTANWIQDVLYKWLDQQSITHEEYVHMLTETILLLACDRSAIFVGRGAQFILPRSQGVAVRLVAPERYRIEQVMRERGLSREEAAAWVAERDRQRDRFIRDYFHAEPNDPHVYDMVLQVGRLSPDQAADVIHRLFQTVLG